MIRLVEVKPELPVYTRGFIAGIEAGYQLGVLMAAFCEGDEMKSRLLLTNNRLSGGTYDGHSIESSCFKIIT